MTQTPHDHEDDPVTGAGHALRASERLLGTAPSARTRAAILRAAAEQARNARAPAANARRRSAYSRWRARWLAPLLSWRPALPVAVAMAVGIFAVALTVQIAEERPGPDHARTAASAPAAADLNAAAGAARAAPPARAPRTAQALQIAEPPAAQSGTANSGAGTADMPQPEAAGSAERVANPVPLPMAPPADVGVRRERAADAAAQVMQSRVSGARAPDRKSAPAQDAQAPSATAAARDVVRDGAQEATRDGASDSAPAAAPEAARGAARIAAPRAAPVSPAAEWMKRIIDLRAAHADAAAERELAAFVRAYPDLAVPDAARR